MSSVFEITQLIKQSFLLGKKEISVYQTCLEHGFLNPTQIARLTGIKRTTIYLVVEELKRKGLLSEKIKGKKKIVGAAPPETLRHLVDQEKERVAKKDEMVSNIIPLLENFQKIAGEETGVEILEGKSGVVILLEKILQKKENIYWLGSLKTILNVVDEEKLYKLFTWRRMDQNTTSHAITDRSILENKKFGEKINEFRQFRFLPNTFAIPGLLVLFGNTVGLIQTREKKVKIILVQDVTLRALIQFMFDSLWETLPDN